MLTLVMMKGLPGSGKSTHAKKLVDKGYTRVNKDDMRSMYHNGKWSKANEQFVLKMRDEAIRASLSAGRSVVVDDTNFEPKHALALQEMAQNFKCNFIEEFIDTPLDECIKRDLARPNSVGEKVIRGMYNKYLRKIETPKNRDDLPVAIICDIDGTLAHMVGRGPYDWERVGEDTIDPEVANVLHVYQIAADKIDHELTTILVSGRDEVCRPQTEKWLKDNAIPYNHLFMRPMGDMRKDTIIKEEIYEREINGKYGVVFVLDDRNQVVEMWRNKGLKVFQVAEGDF